MYCTHRTLVFRPFAADTRNKAGLGQIMRVVVSARMKNRRPPPPTDGPIIRRNLMVGKQANAAYRVVGWEPRNTFLLEGVVGWGMYVC